MFGFFEKKAARVDEPVTPAYVEWKGWRKFKVMNRKHECSDTTTFTLMPADGQPLPVFRAGQGVALRLEGFDPRAYTLCSTPDEGCYRITIKVLDNDRGVLSSRISQSLFVGDEIEVSEPAGGFVLDDRDTPVVMIAEGIGITPMVAMLSEIATDHPLRRVHLIYSTKNGDHFPLQAEIKHFIKLIPDSGMAVGFTEPRSDEHVGQDYQFTGKLMPATLRQACMDAESDVYLCGSSLFVEYVRNIILQYRTIPAEHIHTQVFVRSR